MGLRHAPLVVRAWPTLRGAGVLATPSHDEAWSQPPNLSLDELVDICERHGLAGRGGPGFPLGVKLRAVAQEAARVDRAPHAVANGEEGEPASAKDRFLVSRCPTWSSTV